MSQPGDQPGRGHLRDRKAALHRLRGLPRAGGLRGGVPDRLLPPGPEHRRVGGTAVRARQAAPPRREDPAAGRAASEPLPLPQSSESDGLMPTSTGAQLLVRMLKAEGVRHVFTLSGLHVAPIYAACVEEGIALVDTRHEQAAAHAADATARLTRGIGVCCVTAGPGVTDAVTGIANAWAPSSPVLLLGGAAPTFNAGKGSLQEMEQVDLFTRITKWSDRIPAPDRVPTYLARAFRVMLSGRPGPVFLEVPWDVLSNGADDEETRLPTGYRTRARQPGDPQLIQQAAKLIEGAARVAVVAGSSVFWDDAARELAAFAERAGAPFR